MPQLVTVINKVNNSAIRRIKNERGDLVYVVPSYTLPDDVVMNGGLYPADEIAKSYESLEDTPAPAGHPADSKGNYISANSSEGILYYQCGIFNKNVQRVQDDEHGYRVYVEKHIHVDTANQTDRGRRIIEAIDTNQPIHTSTGLLVDRVDKMGVNSKGKEYSWVATNMIYDHDAILLDKEGAATPDDGVGMMVNQHLIKSLRRDGQLMCVSNAKIDINQSFDDLRETLQTRIQKQFGSDEVHMWLVDFGDDYVVFTNGETNYQASYAREGENVTLSQDAQEVKRKTSWEPVASGTQRVLTSPFVGFNHNNEGDDMAMKDMLKKRLGDKYEENMSDEEMLNAYAKSMKGNAADDTKTDGEQATPNVEVNQADIESMIDSALEKALAANQAKQESSKRTELAEKLKANGVELAETELSAMSVNALQTLADKTAAPKQAFGLMGSQSLEANSDSGFADTLPE